MMCLSCIDNVDLAYHPGNQQNRGIRRLLHETSATSFFIDNSSTYVLPLTLAVLKLTISYEELR